MVSQYILVIHLSAVMQIKSFTKNTLMFISAAIANIRRFLQSLTKFLLEIHTNWIAFLTEAAMLVMSGICTWELWTNIPFLTFTFLNTTIRDSPNSPFVTFQRTILNFACYRRCTFAKSFGYLRNGFTVFQAVFDLQTVFCCQMFLGFIFFSWSALAFLLL